MILGRQPILGLAELESLYGANHLRPIEHGALLDIPAEEVNFKRLGGTIKTARILKILDSSDWTSAINYLKKVIPEHLQYIEGKLTLGISVYGLEVPLAKLNRDLLELKKIVKQTGKPVRIVPNKALELNSAQVLHNKLTHKGAWELLLVRDGSRTVLAQALFVQDIEAYAARDQARPKRDARVGMLPPKLAQILVNLTNPTAGARVLDPFAGTGVVLQEALLMGYNVLGTDIDERMVEYCRANLAWLVGQYPSIEGHVSVETGDATSSQWPRFSAVASEVYLGRPLTALPSEDKLKQITTDVNTITKKFLQNLAAQLKSGQRAALALPAWRRSDGRFINLAVIDHLTDMGYNYLDLKHAPRDDLYYFRDDQVVARRLIRIEKA
jgi:tRNA G10  N-methylase Trm11